MSPRVPLRVLLLKRTFPDARRARVETGWVGHGKLHAQRRKKWIDKADDRSAHVHECVLLHRGGSEEIHGAELREFPTLLHSTRACCMPPHGKTQWSSATSTGRKMHYGFRRRKKKKKIKKHLCVPLLSHQSEHWSPNRKEI